MEGEPMGQVTTIDLVQQHMRNMSASRDRANELLLRLANIEAQLTASAAITPSEALEVLRANAVARIKLGDGPVVCTARTPGGFVRCEGCRSVNRLKTRSTRMNGGAR